MAIYRGDGGAGVANPTYETAVIADQTGNSGKYLTTDGSNTSWATVTGGSSNLDGLTDVTITSPTTGQVLKYNGTIWINDTDSTGSGSFTYPGAGIAVSTGSAWGTSITDNSSDWNTAYTDRLKWDGGATGLNASTGRTSLGLGTAATMTGPSGTIVGTTDTQTLSGKTLTDPIITGTILEDVFTITDGAGFAIDPTNGSIQLVTLGANRTPTQANWDSGEAVTLMIADGTAYTITWTTIGVTWVGGTAPTLATTGYTVIELWKVSTTIYGALVGDVA